MKYILIDSSVLLNKAVMAYAYQLRIKREKNDNSFTLSPTYTYFKQIISILKRIGISKEDKVIFCEDARNSWRKALLPDVYKSGRKETKQAMVDVDWMKEYKNFNEFNKKLNEVTNWHFIKISDFIDYKEIKKLNNLSNISIYDNTLYGLEADDIIAVICKQINDEIIIVSIDGDLDQLCYYKNVKIYNPSYKFSNKRGFYKIIEDPLKNLAKKIRLGDTSDKISGNLNIELKRTLIDLLNLPAWIEIPILNVLDTLNERKYVEYEHLPFLNSLGKQSSFDSIYTENLTLMEESLNRHEKLLKRKVNKNKKKREEIKEKKKEESFR